MAISQEEAGSTVENIESRFSLLKSRWEETMRHRQIYDLMLDEVLSQNVVLRSRFLEYLEFRQQNGFDAKKLFEGPFAYLYQGILAIEEALDDLHDCDPIFAVTVGKEDLNKISRMKTRLQIMHAVAILQYPANLWESKPDIQSQSQSVLEFFELCCKNIDRRYQALFGPSELGVQSVPAFEQLRECFKSMATDQAFIRDVDGKKFWQENFQGLFAVQTETFLDRFGLTVNSLPSLRTMVQQSFDPDQDQIVTQAQFSTLCSRSVFSLLRRKVEGNEELTPEERLHLPFPTYGTLFHHQAPIPRSSLEPTMQGDGGQDSDQGLFADLTQLLKMCGSTNGSPPPEGGREPAGRDGGGPRQSTCVVLLGATGAGKSTMANALAGCQLRTLTDEESREACLPPGSLVVSQEGRPEVARIGRGAFRSETRELQRVDLDPDGLVLWDAPGFGDTGGPVDNIAHAVSLHRLMEESRERGMVLAVLVDYSSLFNRGSVLKNTLEHLSRMRGGGGGGGGDSDGVLLIFTKVPPNLDAPWLRSVLLEGWAEQAEQAVPPWVKTACIFDPLGHARSAGRLDPGELKAAIVRTPPARGGLRISVSPADCDFYNKAAGLALRRAAALLRAGRFDEAAELGETLAALSRLGIEGQGGGGGDFDALLLSEWDMWRTRVALLELDYRDAAREELRGAMEWAQVGAACTRLQALVKVDLNTTYYLSAWTRIQTEDRRRQRAEDQAFMERFKSSLLAAKQELGSEDGRSLVALLSAVEAAPPDAGDGGGSQSLLLILARYQKVRCLASLLDAGEHVYMAGRSRRCITGDHTGVGELMRARRSEAESALGSTVLGCAAKLLKAQLAVLRQDAAHHFSESSLTQLFAAWASPPALLAADFKFDSVQAWEELARLGLAGGWSEAARAALGVPRRLPACPNDEQSLTELMARAWAEVCDLAHLQCAVKAWEARLAGAVELRERVLRNMEREAAGIAGDPAVVRRKVADGFGAQVPGRGDGGGHCPSTIWDFVERLHENSAEVRQAVLALKTEEEAVEDGIARATREWLKIKDDQLVSDMRSALDRVAKELKKLQEVLTSASSPLEGGGGFSSPKLEQLDADLTTFGGMTAAGVTEELTRHYWSLQAALEQQGPKFEPVLREEKERLRKLSASFAASARKIFMDQWHAHARRCLEAGKVALSQQDGGGDFKEDVVRSALRDKCELDALNELWRFEDCRVVRDEVGREIDRAAEEVVPLMRSTYISAAKGALKKLVDDFELGSRDAIDRILRLLSHLKYACTAHGTMESYTYCCTALRDRLLKQQEPSTNGAEALSLLLFVAESISALIGMGTFMEHFKDSERALSEHGWGRARTLAMELVNGAFTEIRRGISEDDYLETSMIRACFASREALKKALARDEPFDMQREWTESIKATMRALQQRPAGNARDRNGNMALVLMKGLRVSTEMNELASFRNTARKLLLDTLLSKEKFEVGLALADYSKRDTMLAGGVSVAELAKTVLDHFIDFQHFSIEEWNRKSSSVTFDIAFKKFTEGRSSYPAEAQTHMTAAYKEYKEVYDSLVLTMITDLKAFNLDAILSAVDSLSTSLADGWPISHGRAPAGAARRRAFRTRRQAEPEPHLQSARLVAHVCAVWTYLGLDCEITGGRDYVRQPHGVQVLALFRLLGVDEDTAGHVLQLNTGEGKSVVLGIGAAILAKLGLEVNVVCYSTYLSERDHSTFRKFFESLKVDSRVRYSDFSELCDGMLEENTKLPNSRLALCALMKREPFVWKPQEVSKSALLFDEIDVFFSDLFFGHVHPPVASIDHDSSFGMLEYIWKNRTLPVEKLIASAKANDHYKALNRVFPRLEKFLCAEIEKAAQDVQCFRGPVPQLPPRAAEYVYCEKTRRVGYVEERSKCVHYNISYGYLTAFTLFSKLGDRLSTPPFADSRPRLTVPSGSIAFSQVPKYFQYIFGITGTLDCLETEKRELLKGYGFEKDSVIPSAYEKKKLVVEPTQVQDIWDEWCLAVLADVKQKLEGERAVLVVFRNDGCLGRFEHVFKNRTWPRQPYCELQLLTDKAPQGARDSVIAKAARRSTVTLVTRSFGRGSDFVCRDQGLVAKGGLHVVLTFYPDDLSEETQIRGRTCRQDDPGSLVSIMFLEWIHDGGLSSATKQEKGRRGWDSYLSQLRKVAAKERMKRMHENGKEQLARHERTLKCCADAAAEKTDEALDEFYSMAYD